MDLSERDRTLITAALALLVAFLAIQVAIAALGVLALIADVLLVFLVAWWLAYLLIPIVDLVDRRTPLARTGSVIVVYLAIALVLAAVLAVGVPAIAGQLAALTERGPEFGEKAAGIVSALQDRLDRLGLRVDLVGLYGSLPERLGELTGAFAADALSWVAATGALLFDTTLVLIIAFLMLVDGDRLWARFLASLSDELRSEAELLRHSADRSVGGFLRASLILAVIYGVGSFLILAPLGVPFAGLLSVVGGLLMIVPFFGPLIAAIPVFVAAILGAPDRALPAIVAIVVLQQLVLNVIGPRLMADVVGIHPLLVFFAILLGARVAGFWGVLLAVPVAGIASSFARYAYEVARGRRVRTQAHLIAATEAAEPEARIEAVPR